MKASAPCYHLHKPALACHDCCKLFALIRFGSISPLEENFSTKANLLITCQRSATDFAKPEFHEWAHAHLEVLNLFPAECCPSLCCCVVCIRLKYESHKKNWKSPTVCCCYGQQGMSNKSHIFVLFSHCCMETGNLTAEDTNQCFFSPICHHLLPGKTLQLMQCMRHFENVMIMW